MIPQLASVRNVSLSLQFSVWFIIVVFVSLPELNNRILFVFIKMYNQKLKPIMPIPHKGNRTGN